MADMPVPMPIVVGAPRSGTTLLRMMLDAHPDLAVPPETGFLIQAEAWLEQPVVEPDALVAAIVDFPPGAPTWPDFGLDRQVLLDRLQRMGCCDVADGIRHFYRLYAERFGKSRWGDKTPVYSLHVAAIARLLPEAHFIHLIRDGRDVALSWRETWFSPGREPAILARAWADHIRQARAQGLALPGRMLEVRYERLLAAPELVLSEICEFIALDFDPAMLSYHEGALGRLFEHQARPAVLGRPAVTWAQRFVQQRLTTQPPVLERAGVWRRDMPPSEQAAFIAVAGDLLRELGYME